MDQAPSSKPISAMFPSPVHKRTPALKENAIKRSARHAVDANEAYGVYRDESPRLFSHARQGN
jgi:hypothetical protein